MFSIAKLLPNACIICESFQDDLVCLGCLKKLSDEALCHYECCRQCGICLTAVELSAGKCDECRLEPPHFDESVCLASYESGLQKSLHDLKYTKRISVAHGLASTWNHILASRLDYVGIDVAMPVPLSQKKLCERGFNQSWEILRRIQAPKTMQKLACVLQRHHAPHDLVGSDSTSRAEAVKGMFYLNPRFKDSIKGRHVVIFDDVMTSKATLNEIAAVLKDNGASRVLNWVLLRTPRYMTKRLQHV